MSKKEREERALSSVNIMQEKFGQSIENGDSFEMIHITRYGRDFVVDLFEEKHGRRPEYNPRTRKWE